MLRLMIQALKVAAIGVLALSVLFISQRALTHYLDAAAAGTPDEPVAFVVQSDESAGDVADHLKEDGLIRSETYFKLKMRLGNKDAQLRPGTFTLHKGMSVNEIISALTTAETVSVVDVRFQEGWRMEQYADKLQEVGLISTQDDFLTEAKSDKWTNPFLGSRPSGASLEGYIFPDTYQFRADAAPDDIINTLLDNFNTKVPADQRAKAQALGYNFNQVMIIASIVEREAVVPSERPIIASVYYNRMKDNMPLQADPTVQYALGQEGNWWPEITDPNHQGADSPYNTYTHPGLPPGPICNPSLASIQAALDPAKTNYLYFVAKNDGSGSHAFTDNYDEQLENIQKYSGQP